MFGISKTLGTILLVVTLLALSTFAAFYYNIDQKKQSELASNKIVEYGQMALNMVFGASASIDTTNLEKKIAPKSKVIEYLNKIDWEKLVTGSSSKSNYSESIENNQNGETFIDELETAISESSTDDKINIFWTKTVNVVKNGVDSIRSWKK